MKISRGLQFQAPPLRERPALIRWLILPGNSQGAPNQGPSSSPPLSGNREGGGVVWWDRLQGYPDRDPWLGPWESPNLSELVSVHQG